MHELISVQVIPLKDLFSDAFHFRLPYFQRAYAWQTGEVGRLLSDITEAMRAGQRGYLLGKLVVAKKKGQPETALVDGHQRVMSLTLLFAVLRDIESDPQVQERLHGFIRGADVRLSPQEAMAAISDRYVQAPGATAIEPEEDLALLSETERNIVENRNYLRAELTSAQYPPDVRRALVAFLAERCCVIVSSVEDEDEAWPSSGRRRRRASTSPNPTGRSSACSPSSPPTTGANARRSGRRARRCWGRRTCMRSSATCAR